MLHNFRLYQYTLLFRHALYRQGEISRAEYIQFLIRNGYSTAEAMQEVASELDVTETTIERLRL